jgi:hypothetical protein
MHFRASSRLVHLKFLQRSSFEFARPQKAGRLEVRGRGLWPTAGALFPKFERIQNDGRIHICTWMFGFLLVVCCPTTVLARLSTERAHRYEAMDDRMVIGDGPTEASDRGTPYHMDRCPGKPYELLPPAQIRQEPVAGDLVQL